ncbi:MAG: hypothetical protein SFV19_06700 [Rhodospirillaceae bacterium]|nr:hypothetical protein [Rhodospirillaceae bacterium]
MTRITGASRPWAKGMAPEAIDLAGAFTVTSTKTTFGLGTLGTSQVGELIIQNLGLVDVFVGPEASLTAANGLKIPGAVATGTTHLGGLLVLQTGANVAAITSAGSAEVRIVRTKFS